MKKYFWNMFLFLLGYFIFLLLVFFFAIDYSDPFDGDNWPLLLFLVPFFIHLIFFFLIKKVNINLESKLNWIIFCNWISLFFLLLMSLIAFATQYSSGFDGLGATLFVGFILLPLWVIFTLASWLLSYKFYQKNKK